LHLVIRGLSQRDFREALSKKLYYHINEDDKFECCYDNGRKGAFTRNHLKQVRKCSISTRNVRLAALHTFFKFVQYEWPEQLEECRSVLSIKVKKAQRGTINYLSVDGIRLLLSQSDLTRKQGIRDLALLALMYDTGARVQEIIDLTPENIRLNKPYTIKLIGKGNKARIVPLMDAEVVYLKNYMAKNRLLEAHASTYPLFYNTRREKLTRAGVTYILHKYRNRNRLYHKSFWVIYRQIKIVRQVSYKQKLVAVEIKFRM
jgi:site-specific recombinase XerD